MDDVEWVLRYVGREDEFERIHKQALAELEMPSPRRPAIAVREELPVFPERNSEMFRDWS